MDYASTLDYLFSQLPMYQRIGAAAYKTDLSNTIALCKALGNPENKFKSVHLAGTNGKGSTSHMMASVLQHAGYKVGLYTSPHLKDFRERIKINGEMISENEVIEFVQQYQSQFEDLGLSFFEWTVGLAFHYFAKEKVDIAVIETGLGGRLDSTNVITPELSIITNIGLDHMQFLGNTLEAIAGEKAGIIKAGIPVVIGERQSDIEHVFAYKAQDLNCELTYASDSQLKYVTDLAGDYQQANLLTAQVSIEKLRALGWDISEAQLKDGLSNVIGTTGLLGRWQQLNNNPKVICDTGHNQAGIIYIVNQLKKESYNQLHMVIGVVDDKSLDTVLSQLPKDAIYYFCKANIHRALDATILQKAAKEYDLDGDTYSSVQEALNAAKENAATQDFIFVGGSTFVVAEVV